VINAIAGMGYVFASDSPRARLLRPLVLLAMRLLLDGPETRTIVQNGDDLEVLAARGIVARERLRLMPGVGVDLERFRPVPEPPGPPRAVLVSRMIREKGIQETVEAARILKARGAAVRIALAGGPDPESPSAIPQSTLERWAQEGDVEILGHVEDIPALWAESHIALLPSYYREGVPHSLIEAAACTRPLIAADGPGLRDIVRDGETGLLVPPRDAGALADAIERLASDEELRRRMGAAGRRLAEARFGAGTINAMTLEVYRELLGARWPPS
jgi:glycosyltransferase involved in cell wall biosynthesis